jgi:acyl carrier protein
MVVAEKTGYPTDMLELDMSLDADLGIDSIKRVEILSALQEKLPNAPTVAPDRLGALRTLRDVVAILGTSPAESAVPAKNQTTVAPRAAKPESDVQRMLLSVVSEKTGYPVEMLDLDMQLDSDLGIDSIKRVEILSGMQERLPDQPTVAADRLGSLRTLRDVLQLLQPAAEKKNRQPALNH